MRRNPHENVATVLVDPPVLGRLELDLMSCDLWVWPVATAPICADGPRQAFQVRRRLIESRRGAWDVAALWTPVWVSFGHSWRDEDEAMGWEAHRTLWEILDSYAAAVRFVRRLGGVTQLPLPRGIELSA